MVLSLIDIEPIKPGFGKVYQSGVIASEGWGQDGLIVSMSGNLNWRWPVLWVDMVDNDEETLPDVYLIAMTDAILAYLKMGIDVLIHCNEGAFRSSYMDVAVHMRAGMSYADAVGLVQQRHPIAELRKGTSAQLVSLENVKKL